MGDPAISFGDMDHYFAESGRTLVVQCVQLVNDS